MRICPDISQDFEVDLSIHSMHELIKLVKMGQRILTMRTENLTWK